jgi:hypothetical protein
MVALSNGLGSFVAERKRRLLSERPRESGIIEGIGRSFFHPKGREDGMATTAIKTTVEPEAAARVAELGMQKEFEEILEHIKQTAPRLQWIEAELEYDPSGVRGPVVTIWAHRDPYPADDDPTNRDWADWFVRAYPPEVYTNFILLSCYEENDGR